MHVSFHIGAHCTDEDQLVKSLLKNKGRLAKEGIITPGPGRYRGILAEVIGRLGGGRASEETQDVLLEMILDVDHADRLVMSHDNFLGIWGRALEHGNLYHLAADKVKRLRNLFPDSPVEFFIGIRDPATFIPALFNLSSNDNFLSFLGDTDPHSLLWSDVIRDIREAVPDCPLTVWCNEDTPMIWPEVLHEVSGLDATIPLRGGFDILDIIMADEGIQRLRTYLTTHPPQNEIQRRRVLSAFLDKYAIEDEVEQELDLPGWTPDLVDELSRAYDEDVQEIASIPGVNFLSA